MFVFHTVSFTVTCENKDGDYKCDFWNNQEYCTGKYAQYMQENCMKSCGVCGK